VALIFLSRPAARAESGSELFVKYCALCHGKDGKATSPAARKLGVKDLSLSQATDAAIIQQITEGRQDERGNLKMPAFQEKLSAAEIQSLLPVVKAFRK
jgi:mono/diheme cytochrome c family protein